MNEIETMSRRLTKESLTRSSRLQAIVRLLSSFSCIEKRPIKPLERPTPLQERGIDVVAFRDLMCLY